MILYQISGTGSQNWGFSAVTNKQRISEKWIADTDAHITTVNWEIFKSGSPSDDATLSIYSGGTNPENGTLQTTVTINSSTFPTTDGVLTSFILASPLAITNGTTYWLTLTRATLSDSDLFTERFASGIDGNAWVYVPIDGGWEVVNAGSPKVDWNIQILDETGPVILARPIFFN